MNLSPPSPLRVLLLVSSPLTADPVDLDAALRRLSDALVEVRASAELQTLVAEADAVSGLLAQRNRAPFQVLHYFGHGFKPEATPEGKLIFEDGTGGMRGLDPFQLRAVLNPGNRILPEFAVAILTACHSESVAAAMGALGVRHVVAVEADESVYGIAAIAFFRRFYQVLLTGGAVREAFDAGCNAVLLDEGLNRLGRAVALAEAGKFKLLPEGEPHNEALPGAGDGDGAVMVRPLPALAQPPSTGARAALWAVTAISMRWSSGCKRTGPSYCRA